MPTAIWFWIFKVGVFTRLPSTTIIKGGSIPFRVSDNADYSFFGGMWGGNGNTYDLTWFSRQIDLLASLGCNTVRIFGDLEQQINTSLNATSYLNRWDEVINYAATKNLYVYVTGASVYELFGVATDGVITEQSLVLLENLLNRVQAHLNVIAFDPIQESIGWVNSSFGLPNGYLHQANISAAQLLTIQQTIYNRLKPQSLIPISFSGVQGSYTSAPAFQTYAPLVNALPYCDYLDFHIYYSATADEVDNVANFAPGKEILIGEFGQSVAFNSGLPGCPYTNARDFMFKPNVVGGLCWATGDQNTDQTDCWGIADNNGNQRANAAILATFPSSKNIKQQQIIVTGRKMT